MIRRSERETVTETSRGEKTWWRVTRLHVFGCCVYTNQVEVTPPRVETTRPVHRPVETTRNMPGLGDAWPVTIERLRADSTRERERGAGC